MYVAGYMQGVTTDPERQAWTSDAPRPLTWASWYPAPPDTALSSNLESQPASKLFRFEPVAENARLSTDREFWPIVLLSHGTGGSAQDFAWLGCTLAAQGFICLGVSHHGNTSIEPYRAEGFLCWWERSRDLSAILDWFCVFGPLAKRIDLDNVYAAGFSLGGYTVLSLAGAITSMDRFHDWLATLPGPPEGPREFPDLGEHIPRLFAESQSFRDSHERHGRNYRDARIKAIAAFAPAPPVRAFEPDSVHRIAVPVQITVGRGDKEAPYDECALWLQQNNPMFEVQLLPFEVGHYVFLPEATEIGKGLEPAICRDPDGVDRRTIHHHAAQPTARLFRRAMAE